MDVVDLGYFPDHAAKLGQIIATFSEIEYAIAGCVGSIINDRRAAVRAIFRLQGPSARVEVADAFMRPGFEKAGLKNEYETALGAARFSRKIRNQYAHAHWMGFKKQGLYFWDLEGAAQTATGVLFYTGQHVDLPLLERQYEYLEYTHFWFRYLWWEHEKRAGRLASHKYKVLKVIEQPPLHNPIEEHPLPKREPEGEQPSELPPEEAS